MAILINPGRKTNPNLIKPGLTARLNPEHELSKGQVGLWLFNETNNRKPRNLALPGNTATTGSLVTYENTLYGKSLHFPFDATNGIVDAGNASQLQLGGKAEFSMWVLYRYYYNGGGG